ncbi:hypothetical protein FB45DRAFT_328455 [Roridomyces roridus]|uniref:Uncharacterized protein n=1 Tax=Roridomyces roridus TaxID=1738132 RepID=A0AAD7B576_9AGAR|nr:hypothetical protein FB45DRAFT_328455 [Roridomyces roridus]
MTIFSFTLATRQAPNISFLGSLFWGKYHNMTGSATFTFITCMHTNARPCSLALFTMEGLDGWMNNGNRSDLACFQQCLPNNAHQQRSFVSLSGTRDRGQYSFWGGNQNSNRYLPVKSSESPLDSSPPPGSYRLEQPRCAHSKNTYRYHLLTTTGILRFLRLYIFNVHGHGHNPIYPDRRVPLRPYMTAIKSSRDNERPGPKVVIVIHHHIYLLTWWSTHTSRHWTGPPADN